VKQPLGRTGGRGKGGCTADLAELQALCPSSDTEYKTRWDAAVNALSTQLCGDD